MSQETQIKLYPKQKELLGRFFESAQKDEEGNYCVPMYNANGELTLFQKDAKAYQMYAYFRIMRLVQKQVFFIKVKKVKRNKKFLCMHEDVFSKIKSQLES